MNVAFIMLPERGGFYPTFSLAKRLVERGHVVRYYGAIDFAEDVRRQGLQYVTLFEDAYGASFFDPPLSSESLLGRWQRFRRRLARPGKHRFLQAIVDGEVTALLEKHGTDLVLLDPLFSELASPLLAGGLRVVSLATELIGRGVDVPPNHSSFVPRGAPTDALWSRLLWVRQRVGYEVQRARRMPTQLVSAVLDPERALYRQLVRKRAALAQRAGSAVVFSENGWRVALPELVLCSRALDFPIIGSTRRYAGPSVDLSRRDVDFPWERLGDESRKLVYVSLGTRMALYGDLPSYLMALVSEIASRRPELVFVIVVGNGGRRSDLPGNVIAVERAPQLALLARTSVMITNGGLGTVKECVWFGVPMVVLPCAVDQAGNSARVVYHHLGARSVLKRLDARALEELLDECLSSTRIRDAVHRMRALFHADPDLDAAVAWLEAR